MKIIAGIYGDLLYDAIKGNYKGVGSLARDAFNRVLANR